MQYLLLLNNSNLIQFIQEATITDMTIYLPLVFCYGASLLMDHGPSNFLCPPTIAYIRHTISISWSSFVHPSICILFYLFPSYNSPNPPMHLTINHFFSPVPSIIPFLFPVASRIIPNSCTLRKISSLHKLSYHSILPVIFYTHIFQKARLSLFLPL